MRRNTHGSTSVCIQCFLRRDSPSFARTVGEPYFTTYQAVGRVLLAIMDADNFHGWTDRAIANKTHTRASHVESYGITGMGGSVGVQVRYVLGCVVALYPTAVSVRNFAEIYAQAKLSRLKGISSLHELPSKKQCPCGAIASSMPRITPRI